jgi:hypothetical protein
MRQNHCKISNRHPNENGTVLDDFERLNWPPPILQSSFFHLHDTTIGAIAYYQSNNNMHIVRKQTESIYNPCFSDGLPIRIP